MTLSEKRCMEMINNNEIKEMDDYRQIWKYAKENNDWQMMFELLEVLGEMLYDADLIDGVKNSD